VTIEWADILENGVGLGVAELSAELKTKQRNLWMMSSPSAMVSGAPMKDRNELQTIS
jgi:hypothetical protein